MKKHGVVVPPSQPVSRASMKKNIKTNREKIKMEVGHWWYGGESPHLGLLSQENNIKIEEKVKVN